MGSFVWFMDPLTEFRMSLEIDFAPYLAHFQELRKPNTKLTVFGKSFTLDELRKKAKEIAEPKNPVNDKKLPQKKGFSTDLVFGKNGKRRLLERIYESNIDAFLRAFPEVVPPSWFVKNYDIEAVVEGLLAFNHVEFSPVVEVIKTKPVVFEDFSLLLPYVPPNYL